MDLKVAGVCKDYLVCGAGVGLLGFYNRSNKVIAALSIFLSVSVPLSKAHPAIWKVTRSVSSSVLLIYHRFTSRRSNYHTGLYVLHQHKNTAAHNIWNHLKINHL